MNEPNNEQPAESATSAEDCCNEISECARGNPGATLFIAIGTVLVIGLLVRALRPAPSPRERLMGYIDDLHDRLNEAAAPMLRKAGAMAGDGAEMLRDRAHDGEAWLGRIVKDARCRLRKMCS